MWRSGHDEIISANWSNGSIRRGRADKMFLARIRCGWRHFVSQCASESVIERTEQNLIGRGNGSVIADRSDDPVGRWLVSNGI